MNPNTALESVIEDSISDALLPVEEETSSTVEETPAEVDQVDVKTPAPEETPEETPAEEVPAATPAAEVDEFEKVTGIPREGAPGRENRIPYSRVKAITENAVGAVAEAALGRRLAQGEKPVDVVKAHVAQIPEMQAKITDYEARLDKVGVFEDTLANQPQKFLQMLATVPAYKEFFEFVDKAYAAQESGQVPAPNAVPEVIPDDMPEPTQPLDDGTKVYDMDGLKGLLSWHAKKIENQVTKQIEARYKPIETAWQAQEYEKSVVPIIKAKIAEAKQWHAFNENEAEITKVLASDPKISLEGAYQKVVFPKLIAERDKMRAEILAEVKRAPTSTALTSKTQSAIKPIVTGPRKLEDIIAEQVATLKQ